MDRRILAVVIGFVLWSVLWLSVNGAVKAARPSAFGEDGSVRGAGILALFLAASVVISIVSGWAAARFSGATGPAAQRPVLWLGVVLLAVGIAAEAAYWSLLPVWYHIAFLAFLLPATLVGGRLRPSAA